ncbi:MAG: hypothetical protein CMJ78_23965 [Planctomycetaceae bacterium]|nr:hypothetical protein [Planctomycetaceae bacterium]
MQNQSFLEWLTKDGPSWGVPVFVSPICLKFCMFFWFRHSARNCFDWKQHNLRPIRCLSDIDTMKTKSNADRGAI